MDPDILFKVILAKIEYFHPTFLACGATGMGFWDLCPTILELFKILILWFNWWCKILSISWNGDMFGYLVRYNLNIDVFIVLAY